MAPSRATIERRQLGAELRSLRVTAGLSQKAAAEVIEYDTSLISRLERGQRAVKTLELEALLDHYGASDEQRSQIAELAQVARRRLPRRTYSDSLPGAFRRLSDHENDATEIYYSDSELIPGLLQTEDYIRAMMALNRPDVFKASEDDVETRVDFRLQRQQLLAKQNAPWMWFVIGEAAIRRPVGGKDVLRKQLLHLIDLIERHSHLTLQIAPLAAADHPLLGSNLEILRFGGLAADVVHQPTFIGGGIYLTDDRDVRECTHLFDRLRATALGPEESRAFIAEHAKEPDHG